jgi:hypothetical protein
MIGTTRNLRRHVLSAVTRIRAALPFGLQDAVTHLPVGCTTIPEACCSEGRVSVALPARPLCEPDVIAGSDHQLVASLRADLRDQPNITEPHAGLIPGARILGRECTAITPEGLVLTDASPDEVKPDRPHRALSTRLLAPPPRRIAGTIGLLGDVGHDNIFHWLFDILPRIGMIRSSGLGEPDAWVIPKSRLAVVPELLAQFGVDAATCIRMGRWSHVSCERLLLSSAPGRVCQPAPASIAFLQDMFRAAPNEAKPGVVVIARRGRRKLINLDAVVERLGEHNPTVVYMEGKDLQGQIGAIAGARCIVAPHGAGLAHMIHAAPGAVIIELLPEHYPNGSFFALAGACGFRYGCIRARAAPGAGRPNSSSDLVVEPHDVLSLVRAALP